MSNLGTKRSFVSAIILSLLVAVALPTVAAGQGRWGGRERRYEQNDRRDNDRYNQDRNRNWKRGKFINGHDARDGRWDNRSGGWDNRSERRDRFRNRNDRDNNLYRDKYRNRDQRTYYPPTSRNTIRDRYDERYYQNRSNNSRTGGLLGAIVAGVLGGQ